MIRLTRQNRLDSVFGRQPPWTTSRVITATSALMYGTMCMSRRANRRRLANEAQGWWSEAPERTNNSRQTSWIGPIRCRAASPDLPSPGWIGISTNRRSCIVLGRGSAANRPCIHCFGNPRQTLRISGSVPEPRPTNAGPFRLNHFPQYR